MSTTLMRCSARNCEQRPELRDTGFSGKHPVKFCPVCKTGYWLRASGITNAWTGKLEQYTETWKPDPLDGTEPAEWYTTYTYWWR